LFNKLPSGPDKRFIVIGEDPHFALLEKNRMQLFLDKVRLTN
jgi:hypothetical protein